MGRGKKPSRGKSKSKSPEAETKKNRKKKSSNPTSENSDVNKEEVVAVITTRRHDIQESTDEEDNISLNHGEDEDVPSTPEAISPPLSSLKNTSSYPSNVHDKHTESESNNENNQLHFISLINIDPNILLNPLNLKQPFCK